MAEQLHNVVATSTGPHEKAVFALIDGESVQFPSIAAKFDSLVAQWRKDRGPHSSASRLAMHPAYQAIIGMGDRVVPLILAELERKPDHWFWALNAITGADPVPESSRGIVREMTNAWLQWGRAHGYR